MIHNLIYISYIYNYIIYIYIYIYHRKHNRHYNSYIIIIFMTFFCSDPQDFHQVTRNCSTGWCRKTSARAVAPGARGQQVVTCRKCWENAGKSVENMEKWWKIKVFYWPQSRFIYVIWDSTLWILDNYLIFNCLNQKKCWLKFNLKINNKTVVIHQYN